MAVDCVAKYGSTRPYFSATTHLCTAVAPTPSPSPTPAPTGSALPSPAASPSPGDSSTGLVCVHGAVVCGSVCACQCASGWRSGAASPTFTSDGRMVYCNVTANGAGDSDPPTGQISAISCSSAFTCFFVDELPYALVRAGMLCVVLTQPCAVATSYHTRPIPLCRQ